MFFLFYYTDFLFDSMNQLNQLNFINFIDFTLKAVSLFKILFAVMSSSMSICETLIFIVIDSVLTAAFSN